MYTLIIINHCQRTSQTIEFTNIRQALNSFIERCDAHAMEYQEDNLGNFYSESRGRQYEFQLISNL